MSKETRKVHEDLLGMSMSTARSRLLQKFLFSVLVRSGENICCRCGKEIETSEQLCLDHVEPWREVSASLFWDLDNIKPAHFGCNSAAKRTKTNFCVGHIPKNSKWPEAPEGTKWCNACKTFVSHELYSKNRTTRDGLNKECNPCRKLARKKK